MSDFYSLKDFADGPHMVADPKGKWAWAADLAAARAEIERLRSSNEALMRERTSMIQTHRTNLAGLIAERDRLRERLTKERDEAEARYTKACQTIEEFAQRAEKAEAERDEATGTIERLNSNNLTLCAELAGWKQSARQMEAERDEARAQVAMAYEAAAKVLDPHDSGTFIGDALGHRICCNGYMCGCRGSTVGDYLQHLIRALTPADAKAALEAYGSEKVREGMRWAAEIIRGRCPECLGTGVRDSGGVHPWGEPITVPCDCADAILGGMETLK